MLAYTRRIGDTSRTTFYIAESGDGMNAIRRDMTQQDFMTGILRGIVAVTQDRRELRGWRLYDKPAHAAAAEVFRRLKKFRGNEFDFRFLIILDDIGYSATWEKAVSDELYLYRSVKRTPDGGFDILQGRNNLERWMEYEHAVGSEELWRACAERFMKTYNDFVE